MDLIELGKFCSDLDNKNLDKIIKLKFLGFNLWKIYRNKIAGDLYAEFQVKQSRKYISSWNILSILNFKKNGLLCRVTSTLYTEIRDGKARSNRIQNIVNSYKKSSVNVSLLGVKEQSKISGCTPEICYDESVLNNYVKLLKYICLIICAVPAFFHFVQLKKFTTLTYKNVLAGMSKFTAEYLVFLLFYKFSNIKTVLFMFASYGHEGEIAALQTLSISVEEYQHGHLYSEHYGYNLQSILNPIKETLLIPEKFYVYGTHWKEVLLGIGLYSSEQIIVSGNPSFENVEKVILPFTEKTIILVCSHPNSGHLYRKFITNYLLKSHFSKDLRFIVKAHPRESQLEWIEYCATNDFVSLVDVDTYSLFQTVDLQLTGSSTTLFEANFFEVSNYILIHDMKITESSDFDASIGQVIDIDYIGKFEESEVSSDENKYFGRYQFAG
ncbi:MAG: hypothetical protein KC646_15575 [Candidatus Cloacimonetes bacterium]|nr:hypothetical protein [Candidatus Cloacimonadota bacterium]